MRNRKWIAIVSILLGFLLYACQKEVDEAVPSQSDARMTFEMGMVLPEMQRTDSRSLVDSFGAKDFPPLWVVVFDGTGYLVEYAQARNFRYNGNIVNFEVTLRATSQKRILHFLLGYADQLQLQFGHESNVMGSMVAPSRQGVYWQRRVLRHGIDAATVEQELQSIPLLRNFARIRVVNQALQDFSLTGFYVLNIPATGTVAPYHEGKFVDYWTGNGLVAKDYTTLVAQEGYTGALPSDLNYLHRPGEDDEGLEWVPDGSAFYLNEHTHTDDPSTTLSVMLKGRYRRGEEQYYKVDLVKQEQEHAVYFHILRNFEYRVHIQKVVGAGEPDFVTACNGLSSNNLSSSIIVGKVQNISDGTSSLRVAYTDTTLVSDAPVQLRYRYVPDLSRPDRTRNQKVKAIWLEGADGPLFEKEIPYAEQADGWATFTFTPLALPPYSKSQTVLIYSEENPLSRQVKFELRPAFPLSITCSPKRLTEQKGEAVLLDLFLPDQLSESLFPLRFLIEAQAKDHTEFLSNTLSPHTDETMSVVSGPSIVEGFEQKRSIQYVKLLEYEDYLLLPRADDQVRHRLSCRFVTNTRHSAARVYVYNKYFDKASDTFGY